MTGQILPLPSGSDKNHFDSETLSPEQMKTLAHDTFLDCLFKEEEIIDGQPIVEPVKVINDWFGRHTDFPGKIGFNPDRLEEHRPDVVKMLSQLPDGMKQSGDVGMMWLNGGYIEGQKDHLGDNARPRRYARARTKS
ncbi:MAG: hypothetical protein LBM73_00825 [Candidatus Nomurabacteria bacterium]|nr:hypothetical protein [Candidatus Nomurabacteria bacterium]